jgi:hypothetical protein
VLRRDAVQAAAETYSGLVEVGVGLIPGGAGTHQLLWRALENIPDGMAVDPYALVTQVFKNIALAKVATSATRRKELRLLPPHRRRVLRPRAAPHEAKQRALGLARSGYHAPAPRAYKLPGESGIATLKMMVDTLVAGGQASEHDARSLCKLADRPLRRRRGAVAPVTEDELLELECEAFLSLCGEPKSQERMQYMLMNNKPLRNYEGGPPHSHMADVVIVVIVRSAAPWAGRSRARSPIHPPRRARRQVIRGLLARNPSSTRSWSTTWSSGCAMPEGEQGLNIARVVGCSAASRSRPRA